MNQNRTLKVVHICTTLNGGAGLCASRIMEATRKLGVDARAVVAYGDKSEYVDVVEENIQWSRYTLIKKFQKLIMLMGLWPHSRRVSQRIWKAREGEKSQTVFTSPVTAFTKLANHPWVKEADIVHLHWIGNFVDYESFFKSVRQPIVWTMHDQNPGLGGFHFQLWKDDAPTKLKKLDDELMVIKRKAYDQIGSMTLVTISSVMDEYAKSNSLLSRFPRVKIPNGVDGEAYVPIDKKTARKTLGIPDGSIVFLFVAEMIHEERKGLDKLVSAIEKTDVPSKMLICLGRYRQVPTASFPIRCEGHVPNSRLQSIYYSAADYYVLPSTLEAFSQSQLEAMACGSPVISFPCSGAEDLIDETNGVVCESFSIKALVNGIAQALSRHYDGKAIRQSVLSQYSYDKVGQRYLDCYIRLLHEKGVVGSC